MGHDEMLQVLKEKMRLEGQLESLSSEASQVRGKEDWGLGMKQLTHFTII